MLVLVVILHVVSDQTCFTNLQFMKTKQDERVAVIGLFADEITNRSARLIPVLTCNWLQNVSETCFHAVNSIPRGHKKALQSTERFIIYLHG